MKILVTGADGFIAKNLIEHLRRDENLELYLFTKKNSLTDLESHIKEVDFIFHLAGVNRSEKVSEFYDGNTGLTKTIINLLLNANKNTSILLSSSTQSDLDTDYGLSKRESETLLIEYSKRANANIYIYKLPNVFGKWAKPNYNSVIATWCYNIANDLKIQINNKDVELNLVYIDDVTKSFIERLNTKSDKYYYEIDTIYKKNLGDISNFLYEFKNSIIVKENIRDKFYYSLNETFKSYKKNNRN